MKLLQSRPLIYSLVFATLLLLFLVAIVNVGFVTFLLPLGVITVVVGTRAWRRMNWRRTARFVALSPIALSAFFPLFLVGFGCAWGGCNDSVYLWPNRIALAGGTILLAGVLAGLLGMVRLHNVTVALIRQAEQQGVVLPPPPSG
jgi:hypothetical protein